MTKEHIYKGNKILEYEDGSFLATKYANGEVDSKTVRSLKQAKAFIDKDSEPAITLESILRDHFGCDNPFLPKPKKRNGETEYLTKEGRQAVDRLNALLGDLAALGVLSEKTIEKAQDELDHILYTI